MSITAKPETVERPSTTIAPTGSARVDTDRLRRLAARVTTTGAEREQMEIVNPATAGVLGTTPRCTGEDIELAATRARAAQALWRKTTFATRREIFLRFHDLVLARQDELLDVVQLESGKARRHAF